MTVSKFGIFNGSNRMVFNMVKGKAYSNSQDIYLDDTITKNNKLLNLITVNAEFNTQSKII